MVALEEKSDVHQRSRIHPQMSVQKYMVIHSTVVETVTYILEIGTKWRTRPTYIAIPGDAVRMAKTVTKCPQCNIKATNKKTKTKQTMTIHTDKSHSSGGFRCRDCTFFKICKDSAVQCF